MHALCKLKSPLPIRQQANLYSSFGGGKNCKAGMSINKIKSKEITTKNKNNLNL
jgi:hypothetical protein